MLSITSKIPEEDSFDDAYVKVEHYLRSLRIKNRRVLSKLVYLILDNTYKKLALFPDKNVTTLAIEEAMQLTSNWCEKVLNTKFNEDQGISPRARVAMMLSDLPDRWVKSFLSEDKLPADLIEAMQKSYISSGPDFQIKRMKQRALEFNPAGNLLAGTLGLANRIPVLKWAIAVLIFVAFMTMFLFTR